MVTSHMQEPNRKGSGRILPIKNNIAVTTSKTIISDNKILISGCHKK